MGQTCQAICEANYDKKETEIVVVKKKDSPVKQKK